MSRFLRFFRVFVVAVICGFGALSANALVTLNDGGAIYAGAPHSIERLNSNTQLMAFPYRPGYGFAGYYTAQDCASNAQQILTHEGTWTGTQYDGTIYACWVPLVPGGINNPFGHTKLFVLDKNGGDTVGNMWPNLDQPIEFDTTDYNFGGTGRSIRFENRGDWVYLQCYIYRDGICDDLQWRMPRDAAGNQAIFSPTKLFWTIQGVQELPTRSGYAFGGMYSTSGTTGGTQYCNANGNTTDINSLWNNSLPAFNTIYARWNAMTVYLNGTGVSPNPVYFYGGNWYSDSGATQPITALTSLPQNGSFDFLGYYTAPDGGGIQIVRENGTFLTGDDVTGAITDGIHLYPLWQSAPTWATLTINDRDETTGSVPKPLYYPLSGCSVSGFRATQSCDAATVNNITVPTKNGWVYGGHFADAGGTGRAYINPDGTFNQLNNGISGDLTIYAKWTFSISYSTGGSATCTYGTTCAAAAAPEPPSSGQVFNGWACTLSNGGACAQSVYPEGGNLANATNNTAGVTGITLTATWSSTAPTYVYKKVTLDLNGGTIGPAQVINKIFEGFNGSVSLGFFTCQSASCNSTGSSCTCEGATAILGSIFDAGISRPTNGNNAFGGYYTHSSGGYERVDSEGFIKGELYSAAPVTIYAHWVAPQEVKLDAGAMGSWSNCSGKVLEYAGLPLTPIGNDCKPTAASGYTFKGYFDGNTKYYDGNLNPVRDAWPMSNAPTELVAGYDAVLYAVNYYCGNNLVHTEYVANNAPYTIWDGNGGTACGDPVSASPSSAGSRLAGWQQQNTSTEYGLGQNVSPFVITGSINLVSVTRSIYYVTLNHNNPDNTPSPDSVYFWNGHWYTGNTAVAPSQITTMNPKPVMAGYTFNGYYTGNNGTGTQVIDSEGDFIDVPVTTIGQNGAQITANWTMRQYAVQLIAGNGTCDSGCSTYMYYQANVGWTANSNGSTPITSINPPTPPTGQVFSGYYTGQNGTGTLVVDGSRTIQVTGTDALNLLEALGGGTSTTLKFYAKYDDIQTAPTNPNGYFAVTTTELAANTEFKFAMSAAGDFWVDWDADNQNTNSIVRITPDNTNLTMYSHVYGTSGAKTIKIWRTVGTSVSYNTDIIEHLDIYTSVPAIYFGEALGIDGVAPTSSLVAAISGSLGAVFPTVNSTLSGTPSFSHAFKGCSNLNGNIPEDLFGYMSDGNYVGVTGSRSYMFSNTFANTGLTSIPGTLFGRTTINGTYYGVSGAAEDMFAATFAGMPINTDTNPIPENLFIGITGNAKGLFASTFAGCTNLKTVQAGLFSGVSGAANQMFRATFMQSGLTSLPPGLFGGVSGVAQAMFNQTFAGCNHLQLIPDSLFSGVSATGNVNDSAASMFYGTFVACTALTALPATLFGTIDAPGVDRTFMFSGMFANNTALGGYIPKTLFANVTDNDATYFMTDIFGGDTNLATSCGSYNLTQYTTGFEDYWNGHVSCAPVATFSCGIGSGTAPSSIFVEPVQSGSVTFTFPAVSGCSAPNHYNNTNRQWTCDGSACVYGTNSHVYWGGGETYPTSNNVSWDGQQNVEFDMTYTPETYTITLKRNHDSNDDTNVGTITETYATSWSGAPTIPASWSDGTYTYNFDGYFTTRDNTGARMTDLNGNFVGEAATFMVGASGNWYAHWTTMTGPFTATFKCDEDSNTTIHTISNIYIDPTNHPNADVITMPALSVGASCTKTGYEFARWKVLGTNDVVNPNATYTWTLYGGSDVIPDWQPVQTTITLSPNGGTGGPAAVYTRYANGVYRDSERTVQMTTGNNPLTSLPMKTVNITFALNDGNSGDATLNAGGQSYSGNNLLSVPVGLPFQGYYNTDNTRMIKGNVKENGSQESNPGHITSQGDTDGKEYTTNQTWTAVWQPKTVSNQDFQYQNYDLENMIPTWDGHVFLGWFTATSGGQQITDGNGNMNCENCFSQSINGNKTWYAHWQVCSHTQPSDPHATMNAIGAIGGACAYHIVCDQTPYGYTQYGGNNTTQNFDIIATVGSYSGVLDSAKCLPRTYSIDYQNVTEHGGTLPAGTIDTYTYGVETEVNAVPTSPSENFESWCTGYDESTGVYSGCATTQTIPDTTYGDKPYYAKWAGCKTGYRTYNYDVRVTADYDNQSHEYLAGACAPGNYVVTCNKNCPAGETCNACLEDIFSQYHLGQRYGVYSQQWETQVGVVGALGAVLPHGSGSQYLPFGGDEYGQSGDTSFGIRPLYSYNGIGAGTDPLDMPASSIFMQNDYVAYMTALTQLNNKTFGTSHYDFNGLWTDATSEDSQYRYLPTVNGTTPWSQRNADGKALSKFFTSDATVYAHWIPHVYSVKLMRNHSSTDYNQKGTLYEEYGNGWNNANTGTFGTNYQLPSDLIPSWTGYTFSGYWTTRDDSGTQLVAKVNNAWTVTADAKTLVDNNAKWYAHWTPKQFTITLDNADALVNGTASLTSIYDSGAYLNVDGTLTLMDKDNGPAITLPEHKYTVSFDLNYNGAPNGPATQYPGWTFNGYFSASSNGTKYIAADGKITQSGTDKAKILTANATWNAQWTQVANLTLPDVYNSGAGYFGQPGYVFIGWWTTSNENAGTSVGVNGDTYDAAQNQTLNQTLYAQWRPCSYTGATGATSVSVATSDLNACVYTITCPANYTCEGNNCEIIGEPDSYATVTLPDCVGAGHTITYYDNPAYGTNVELNTQSYTYNPNGSVTLNPDLNNTVYDDHHAASVQWCDIDGNNCVTQIAPQNQTGDIALYAKWTCATGYTSTYTFDAQVAEYGSNSGFVEFNAGMCAPKRYRIICDKNCPTYTSDGQTVTESCNACLEDFSLLQAGTVGKYSWGYLYNSSLFDPNGALESSQVPVPVYSVNSTLGDFMLFTTTPKYEHLYLWPVPLDENASLLGALNTGNYKTFMMALANEQYNSSLDFGAQHYTFDGLWTAASDGEIYINANGWVAGPNNTDSEMHSEVASKSFTSDTDVYAHWDPKVYDITLDPDDGTPGGSMSGTVVTLLKQKWNTGWKAGTHGDFVSAGSFQLSGPQLPTRDGYIFNGYYTQQNCQGTKIVNADGTLNLNATSTAGDVQHATYFENENGSTLYACWESLSYNISYDWNGGSHDTCSDSGNPAVCPSVATFGGNAFRVPAPTHEHGTFKGWIITGMDDGVAHKYGQDSSVTNTTTNTGLDLSQTNDGPSMVYFKDLRGSAGTVTFTAKWECTQGWGNADCSEPGAHVITIKAGYGVSKLNGGTGWSGNDTGTITRSYNTDGEVTLGDINATLKGGYTGRTYRVTVSGNGQLIENNTKFKVGSGDATIYIDATGITTPVPTISGGATKVYNYQSTTLTGTVSNSTDYDSGISFTYRFGVSDTSDGTYDYTTSDINTKTIAKDAYLDTKYHKVEITAHGEGELASSAGVSATPAEVKLQNAPIKFNVGTGETLVGSSPLYAPYNINGNLYSGEFSPATDTPATVPSATKSNYNFAGWWTSADGGSMVYDGDRTLTSNNVSGYVNYANGETKWVVTSTNGKDLYPHWDGKIYTITLDRNGATNGTATFYEKYDNGYALSSNPTDWTTTLSITVPTKTGHTFGGYYANSNFSGAQVIGTDGALPTNPKYFTQSKTLYAKWTANTYNISYNTNGGTAGTDQPETVTFGTVFHVDNPTPTGHQTSFAGWNVTNMQSGVTHYYGTSDSNVAAHGTGTSWGYTTITPDRQYFKNLRANADATVKFTAVWNCEYPYEAPACSEPGDVKVTVNPGAGVSTVAGVGDGWVSDGSGSVYKYFDFGEQITLSTVVSPVLKLGYIATSGYAYTKTSGAGTLNNGVFTVGDGDAEITVAATGVKTPVPTISGGVTQIYNYQDVTLVGTLGNSTDYGSDSGISFAYQYGYSTSSDGTYGNWTTSPTVGAAAFHGTRYYKAKITASGEGGLSATGTSSNPTEVTLTQRTVTFNPNGGTLGDSSGRYIRYNSPDLYTTATSDTPIAAPTVTRNYYTFDGWWTTSSGDGSQIYDANGNLTTTTIAGWTGEYGWAATQDRTLYARWNGNVYKLNLNKNGGTTNGSAVTVLNEKYGTGWRIGTSGNFSSSVSLSGDQLPTMPGHTFAGYYDEATNGNPKGTFENGSWTTPGATTITAETTWYAHWTPNTYTVTYDCGIGNGAGSTDTATYNPNNDPNGSYTTKTLAQANCETSLMGHYFNGWNVTPGHSASDTWGAGVWRAWDYTENQTLTARWVAKEYHITFDNNGATTPGTSQVWEHYGTTGGFWHDAAQNHVTTITLPQKTGHTFNGYALNGVTYIDTNNNLPEPTLTFGDTSNNATVDITLTAQWTPITYNIYYDENGGSRTLPAGYTPREFIESNGTQYIDTGIKGNMGYTYELEFQQTDTGNYRNWGVFNQSGYSGQNMSLTYVNGWAVRWEARAGQRSYVDLGTKNTDRHVLRVVDGEVYFDGVDKGKSAGHDSSFEFNYNLFLGTINPGGTTPSSNAKSRYYSYRVWNASGELIQNLIPVSHVENGVTVVGMYDTVSGQFFTSVPSGTNFAAGPAVDISTTLYPNNYTYGVGAKIYAVPMREHSVFQGWCRTENPFTGCAMPYEITTTDLGDKTLYAKWRCETGYSDTGSACVANTIILNWNENNGNYQELPNDQCTYGGDLTLPGGAPVNSNALVFNGWKLVNNDYVDGGDTVTNGCVETYTGVTSGTSTGIMAQWCNACNTTHATCTLDATTVPGTCSYTTACESGYHLSPDSALNVYNTVCIPYTITYDANGHGNGAVDDNVRYNQTFTTNDAKDTDEFLWANHIVTTWTRVSGGNFPNVGAEYPYNVQSDTTLRANWGECNCTPGTNATACSTTSSNNECQVNVITCATGYTGTSWSCDGTDCTASCSDSHNHTISLQHALSGVTGGTNTIYSIDSGASSGAGVYLDNTHQQLMAVSGANSNPVTLPDSFAYTVTYDVSGGTLETGAANSAQAVATFNGYYDSANGEGLYISGDTGNITSEGIAAGTSTNSDATWWGQWTIASITLPIAYRPGYVFAGWFVANGATPVGNNEGQFTPGNNVTLYAHWTECAAGNYCPGMETVDGETLYNTVYSCSQATNGKYENSVAGSDDISDCYLVLEAGKWVETVGAGKVACTEGYYCNDNATQVYYSDPGDNRRTTGIRNACPTGFANTVGTGNTSINQCYKNVTLNKRGGSGNLGGASGTNNGSRLCYYDIDCTLPDASVLVLTGHTFHGGWTDQADTDCDSTTRVFNMPNDYPDTDTFYACRTTNAYTVTLKDGIDTNTTYGTVSNVTYGQPMPTVAVPEHSAQHTTYTFTGYYDNPQTSNSGVKYYNADGTSAKDWDVAQNASLYAWWDVGCDAGYYLPANSFVCTALCPAGKYCAGNMTFSAVLLPWDADQGISGVVAAGYYSTGGGTIATPTAAGNGCVTGNTCGIVSGGYYSTGGGTAAAPTETGNGCLSGYTCGILSADYFSNGGGTVPNPSGTQNAGCVSGQTCGTCPVNYRAATDTTGKTVITQCVAACIAGQRVVNAADPDVNSPYAAGCTTPSGNLWWSDAHNVNYGSASPAVSVATDTGVHTCATNYATVAPSNDPNDHNEQSDCKRNVWLNKNGGTTIDGATWPEGVTDNGDTQLKRTCQEGVSCAFGNPALLLEKPGWTFQNAWGTNASCTGTTYESPVASPLTSAKYYACKNQIDYTLTYACGTGTGTAPVHTTPNPIHYGNTVTVAAVGDCAKTGHHFTGWAVSNSEDVVQPGNMTWNYEENKTFTAQWAPDVYDIDYDWNGGNAYSSAVPAEYSQVGYVDMPAGSYLLTDIIPTYDGHYELDFQTTTMTASPTTYLGARTSSSTNGLRLAHISSGVFRFYGFGSYVDSTVNCQNNTRYKFVWDNKDCTLTTGDTTIISKTFTTSGSNTTPLSINAWNTEGAINGNNEGIRVYSFKAWNNQGTLIANYVPVKDSNDEAGFYDTVSGEFKGATAGTLSATDEYPMEYTYGVGATVYGVPVRANSVFEGWCRTESAGNTFDDCAMPHEITTTDIEDKLLHAKWSCDAGYHLSDDGQSCVGNEITIQYNKNGHGTELTPQSQTCIYGSQSDPLANGLTQQGWWFMGWNVPNVDTFDAGETIPCDVDHLGVTTGTVTLNANWEPWCNKITLDKNNDNASYGIRYLYAKTREAGDTHDSTWYKNDTCTVEYTSADYESVKPSRTGLGFRGFYQSSSDAADINATQTNGAAQLISHTGAPTTTGRIFVNGLTGDVTIYAGWAQDCANSISNGTCSRTLGANTSYATTCATGYHYGTAPDGVTYNPATQNNTSESTYNPICVADTINIVLDKNGGTGTCGGAGGTTSGTMTCYYDGTCNTPIWNSCSISNGARIFTGWNTESDGTGTPYGSAEIGVGIDTTDPTILANGLTLYAQWADVTCNVSHGTATASATATNTPTCWVDSDSCDNGYSLSANPPYYGTQHTTTVNTGQCNEATYDINYEWNGGNEYSSVVPPEYTQLDYLTFSGDQYIDTGVILTNSQNIENVIEMQADSASGFQTWTGFMKTSEMTPRYGINFYGNKWMIGINATSSNGVTADSGRHIVKFVTTNNAQILYDTDGTTELARSSLDANALSSNVLPLYIGARNNSGTPVNFVNGNIGRTYLKQNGVMLYNLIPARHNSDGVLGMYDTVTGTFFINEGIGNFGAGNVVTNAYPTEYTYGIGATVYGVPVRANSVFDAWCRNAALTENCTMPHEITTTDYGDKDLYAKWSCVDGYQLNANNQCVGNDITITYQKGTHGVGNPPQPVTKHYNDRLELEDAMSGEYGWTFVGWQINGVTYNGGDRITLDFDTLGMYSGNINAIAQWEADVYTVHYNCNTTWPDVRVPADGYPTTGVQFWAASASSCVNPGYHFVGWLPESDWLSTIWVNGTEWNLINRNDPTDTDVIFTAQWERDDPAFTVMVTVPAGTTFSFDTFASGQFWVDWNYVANPGVSVDEFETATVVAHTWSHEYTTAGTYVIGIGGRASGYFSGSGTANQRKAAISFFNGTLDGTGVDAQIALDDNEQPLNGSEQYIVSAKGSLGSIFPTIAAGTYHGQPRFYRTFKNTFAMTQRLQNLADLFDGIYGDPVPYMFAELFDGSAITGTIPAGLFPVDGTVKTALFLSTFRGCAGLSGTIPADLFKNIAGAPLNYMFSRTFRGCTNLTGIPVGLFRNISGAPAANMFSYTFMGCSNITGTLSKNLFGNIDGAPAASMFTFTFNACTKLQGDTSNPEIAIPDGMFGKLRGAAANYMFHYTFYNCSELTGKIGGALFGGLTGEPATNMFYRTFSGCSKLSGSIPNNLFGNMTGAPKGYMFRETFYGCSNLTGNIPDGLFGRPNGSAADYMFYGTFYNCGGLTGKIPDGLFGTPSGTADYMFYATFYNCGGLTGEIPSRLFGTPSGAPSVSMFSKTFYGCGGLTGTIPSTLFGTLSDAGVDNMFYQTFYNCANLNGYVPDGLFGTMTAGGTTSMYRVFAGSGLLTECPCGTTDVSQDSPFYSYWQSTASSATPKKVSCRVDTTPGDFYWYGGECSTICPVATMDELHVANLTPYPVLARKVSDVAINIKYGDTTCYVPLTAGNGGANSLNMKYNNTVYHADRPGTTPPAGFGQR